MLSWQLRCPALGQRLSVLDGASLGQVIVNRRYPGSRLEATGEATVEQMRKTGNLVSPCNSSA